MSPGTNHLHMRQVTPKYTQEAVIPECLGMRYPHMSQEPVSPLCTQGRALPMHPQGWSLVGGAMDSLISVLTAQDQSSLLCPHCMLYNRPVLSTLA